MTDKGTVKEDKKTESTMQKETASKSKSKSTPKAKKQSASTIHKKQLSEAKAKIVELNDKYLRLSAEFDNYRKRTLKEKMELTKTGGEMVLINILPVMDNLERALGSVREAKDLEAVKLGIELIYSNFKDFLQQSGVKEVPALNEEFNTDQHEAITKIPTPDKDQKGKVVDVIEKGYYLGEKVIRYAKVVVGE